MAAESIDISPLGYLQAGLIGESFTLLGQLVLAAVSPIEQVRTEIILECAQTAEYGRGIDAEFRGGGLERAEARDGE